MKWYKRFDHVDMFKGGVWASMIQWCQDKGLNYHAQYPTFYFEDEKEYTVFLLRWQ